MSIRSVWLVFNIVEIILCAICAGIHIDGMLYVREPLPHHMYFCGSYSAFFFISALSIMGVYFGTKPPIIIEVIIAACGTVSFLLTSIFSMYYAERDFHLMYLSDTEESFHPFFMTSKAQSIASLLNAVTYLLHFTFGVDAMVITEESIAVDTENHSYDSLNSNYCALRPIKTNLICWSYFKQFQCCDKWLSNIEDNEDEYAFSKDKELGKIIADDDVSHTEVLQNTERSTSKVNVKKV